MSTYERVGSYVFAVCMGALAAIVVITSGGKGPVDMYRRGVLDQLHGRAIIRVTPDTAIYWP